MGSLQGIHANPMTWGSVFDGHGGTHVSSAAASKMHSVVESNPRWRMLSGKRSKGLIFKPIVSMGWVQFLISYLG